MKAMRIHQHGGPEVLTLEQIDPPRPGAGEVTIEVKACAMNHLDLWTRNGLPGLKIPMPHVLGSDISGVVAEVGPEVEGVSPGDEVAIQPGLSCGRCLRCLQGRDNECRDYKIFGYQVDGGYTERLNVPVVNLLPKPKSLSFEESASVLLVFLTAWHMLVERARLRPGEEVLVLAAGSGVGIAAIQIAKLWGARVIATASTDAKLEKARGIGADEIINYREKDFAEESPAAHRQTRGGRRRRARRRRHNFEEFKESGTRWATRNLRGHIGSQARIRPATYFRTASHHPRLLHGRQARARGTASNVRLG